MSITLFTSCPLLSRLSFRFIKMRGQPGKPPDQQRTTKCLKCNEIFESKKLWKTHKKEQCNGATFSHVDTPIVDIVVAPKQMQQAQPKSKQEATAIDENKKAKTAMTAKGSGKDSPCVLEEVLKGEDKEKNTKKKKKKNKREDNEDKEKKKKNEVKKDEGTKGVKTRGELEDYNEQGGDHHDERRDEERERGSKDTGDDDEGGGQNGTGDDDEGGGQNSTGDDDEGGGQNSTGDDDEGGGLESTGLPIEDDDDDDDEGGGQNSTGDDDEGGGHESTSDDDEGGGQDGTGPPIDVYKFGKQFLNEEDTKLYLAKSIDVAKSTQDLLRNKRKVPLKVEKKELDVALEENLLHLCEKYAKEDELLKIYALGNDSDKSRSLSEIFSAVWRATAYPLIGAYFMAIRTASSWATHFKSMTGNDPSTTNSDLISEYNTTTFDMALYGVMGGQKKGFLPKKHLQEDLQEDTEDKAKNEAYHTWYQAYIYNVYKL